MRDLGEERRGFEVQPGCFREGTYPSVFHAGSRVILQRSMQEKLGLGEISCGGFEGFRRFLGAVLEGSIPCPVTCCCCRVIAEVGEIVEGDDGQALAVIGKSSRAENLLEWPDACHEESSCICVS